MYSFKSLISTLFVCCGRTQSHVNPVNPKKKTKYDRHQGAKYERQQPYPPNVNPNPIVDSHPAPLFPTLPTLPSAMTTSSSPFSAITPTSLAGSMGGHQHHQRFKLTEHQQRLAQQMRVVADQQPKRWSTGCDDHEQGLRSLINSYQTQATMSALQGLTFLDDFKAAKQETLDMKVSYETIIGQLNNQIRTLQNAIHSHYAAPSHPPPISPPRPPARNPSFDSRSTSLFTPPQSRKTSATPKPISPSAPVHQGCLANDFEILHYMDQVNALPTRRELVKAKSMLLIFISIC